MCLQLLDILYLSSFVTQKCVVEFSDYISLSNKPGRVFNEIFVLPQRKSASSCSSVFFRTGKMVKNHPVSVNIMNSQILKKCVLTHMYKNLSGYHESSQCSWLLSRDCAIEGGPFTKGLKIPFTSHNNNNNNSNF